MIKVAIIGFGFMGKTHADAYAAIPSARIVAVGDVKEDLLRSWQAPYPVKFYTDLSALIRKTDADVLDICLPTFLHEEFVTMAVKRRMHVLCEKPFALSTAAADRMLAAAHESKVTLMVAQVLRFFAHYTKVQELVKSGSIGEVIYAHAARLSESPRWAKWFSDPEKSGGALFDLHIHDLDYILDLFGLPQSLYATGVQSKGGCWDQVCNVLTYPGKRVVIEASYSMPAGWPFTTGLRVVGTTGAIEYNFRVQGNVNAFDRAQHSLRLYENGKSPAEIEIDDPNPYLREIEYFVGCIERGEEPSRVPSQESRDVIAVLEAAKKSLETGMPVMLDHISTVARKSERKEENPR
jgi:predicted dehydrogenase